MTAKVDVATDKVVAQIAMGQHDLSKIGDAIRSCIAAGIASPRWYFDLDALEVEGVGGTFDEYDLTLTQSDIIERVSGYSWTDFNPLNSPRLARPLLVAAFESCGIDREQGEPIIGDLKLDKINACMRTREVRPADPT